MTDLLNQMCQRVMRHADESRVQSLIPRLTIGSSRQTAPTIAPVGPGVCLVLQGGKQMLVGSRTLHYSAGACFASVIELPTTCCTFEMAGNQPYIGTGLSFDHELFTALIADVPEAASKPVALGFNVGVVSHDVLEAWNQLLALLDRPNDIPVLAIARERELLYRLLQSAHGPLLRQMAREEGKLAQIRRAIAWMREHFNESFHIQVLAEIAGMSVPSFNRHFRATTSTSPLQYQKTLRLQAARSLLAANSDATRTAYAVGYESPSQFSREYTRLFGLSPKRDASTLRKNVTDITTVVF